LAKKAREIDITFHSRSFLTFRLQFWLLFVSETFPFPPTCSYCLDMDHGRIFGQSKGSDWFGRMIISHWKTRFQTPGITFLYDNLNRSNGSAVDRQRGDFARRSSVVDEWDQSVFITAANDFSGPTGWRVLIGPDDCHWISWLIIELSSR
jgi:hypothetical protein